MCLFTTFWGKKGGWGGGGKGGKGGKGERVPAIIFPNFKREISEKKE